MTDDAATGPSGASRPRRRPALALRTALAASAAALRETAADRRMAAVLVCWGALNLATWMATVALTVAAYRLAGPGGAAVVVVARSVPAAVLGPLVAVAARRWRPLNLMTAAVLASAVGIAGAAVTVDTLPALLVLVGLHTTATNVYRSAQSAALPALADGPRQLTSANALTQAVKALGVFAGPALAGAAMTLGGPRAALAAAALITVAGAAVLLTVDRGPATAAAPEEAASGVREVGALPARRTVRLLVALVLAQNASAGALTVLYPSLAQDLYGLGLAGVGTLTAAYGAGQVVGAVGLFALAGSAAMGRTSSLALVLWGAPLAALALLTGAGPALPLLAVAGLATVMFDLTVVTLLQRAVPPSRLTSLFAMLGTVAVLGTAVGAALGAQVTAVAGPAAAAAALALPLLVAGLASRPALVRLDRTLAAPWEQVALLRALPAFELLPTPDVERLALRLRRVPVAAGETVARQGEPGSTYWLVAHGILTTEVDGRHVADMGAGDAFGEIALLRDVPRTATVRARTRCVLWALDRDDFLTAMRDEGSRRVTDAVAEDRLRRAAPGRRG